MHAYVNTQVFSSLHVPMVTGGGPELLCFPVWYQGDLPWNADLAFDSPNCIFSLVQSTTLEPARNLLRIVDKKLKERNISFACS